MALSTAPSMSFFGAWLERPAQAGWRRVRFSKPASQRIDRRLVAEFLEPDDGHECAEGEVLGVFLSLFQDRGVCFDDQAALVSLEVFHQRRDDEILHAIAHRAAIG